MRHPGLIAFAVTTAILVPAGMYGLEAGPAQRAKLFANRTRSLTLGESHIQVALDRNFANVGATVHLKLSADKPATVAVVVIGTTGNENMRVENPPRAIAHQTVELAADASGTIAADVPIVLEGAAPENLDTHLGHYTFYVMDPGAADQFEGWRRARTSGGRERAVRGNKDLEKLVDMIESTWAPIDQPHYKLSSIASVDAYTRTAYRGFSIKAPNRARIDEPFVATLTIKNPRIMTTTFNVSVRAPTIDYRGTESDADPITIVDGEQSAELAPGETRKLEFKVTGNRRGTFALQARVDCGDGCNLYEGGAFEAVDIDGKRPAVAAK